VIELFVDDLTVFRMLILHVTEETFRASELAIARNALVDRSSLIRAVKRLFKIWYGVLPPTSLRLRLSLIDKSKVLSPALPIVFVGCHLRILGHDRKLALTHKCLTSLATS